MRVLTILLVLCAAVAVCAAPLPSLDDDALDWQTVNWDTVEFAEDFSDLEFSDDMLMNMTELDEEALLDSLDNFDIVPTDVDWLENMPELQPELFGAELDEALASMTIRVGDITRALNSGGSNPVESLIIQKVLGSMNAKGLTVRGGSLVYNSYGKELQISSSCKTKVSLRPGWNMKCVLRPASSVTLSMGFDKGSLVVGTNAYLDTSLHVTGAVRLKKGKKVFRKCIRLFRKTQGFTVGGSVKLTFNFQLSLKPSIAQEGSKIYLKFTPKVRLYGRLISFQPDARIKIKILGIKIGFLSKLVEKAVKKGLSDTFTNKGYSQALAALTNGIQQQLDAARGTMKIELVDLNPSSMTKVRNAVNNVIRRQG